MEERATLKEMVRKLNEVLKTRVAPGPLNANPNIPQILYDIIANNDVYLNVLRDQNRPEFKTSCGQAQSRFRSELKQLERARRFYRENIEKLDVAEKPYFNNLISTADNSFVRLNQSLRSSCGFQPPDFPEYRLSTNGLLEVCSPAFAFQ